MKVKVTTMLLQPEVIIDIDPEDVVWNYSKLKSADEVTDDMMIDAAIDDFYYHHLKQSVIEVEFEKVEE